MYGAEDSDLVVRYYDCAFGIHGKYEDAWYLNKVKKYGGPVLDLACGTGRMALMIARAGFNVVGVDNSEGMLNQFIKALDQEPGDICDRITIAKQDMISFQLGRKFSTIICCDAFFHILTVADEIECLARVADHLTERGGFLFNLPNPNCAYIIKGEKSAGKVFEERGRYPLMESEETLVVEQAKDAHPPEQIITTKLRFTILDADGHQRLLGCSSWKTRYLFQYEAIHLLYRCGFKVESLVGDYQGGPVKEGSQLIFETVLQNK
jgi:SAM-dependent methyltransferase